MQETNVSVGDSLLLFARYIFLRHTGGKCTFQYGASIGLTYSYFFTAKCVVAAILLRKAEQRELVPLHETSAAHLCRCRVPSEQNFLWSPGQQHY